MSQHLPTKGRTATVATALIAILAVEAGAQGAPSPDSGLAFADVTDRAGLDRVHYPADLGAGKIIATMGGGVAWGDYDHDGDLDLYVTQGVEHYEQGETTSSCGLLFRNDGDWQFEEVSARAGIRACGWGSAVVFEDADHDGDLDLLLTFVGDNELWLNRGDGTFEPAGAGSGVAAPGYNCGAAFLDYDRDGDLDIYLARYVETDVESERAWPGFRLRMPESYPAPPNVLLRNDGAAGYRDVTEEAGVADDTGRGLAVIAADLDEDGWPDLYVANDRSRNTLFRNLGDGSFEDATDAAGVGTGHHGKWESAMGLAIGDVDRDGHQDLLVTNYVEEPNTLFLNLGDLVFVDGTRQLGIYEASYDWVGWGAELADFDADGYLDLFVANGHILPMWIARIAALVQRDELTRAYSKGGYRQPLLLFRGGERRFETVAAPAGGDLFHDDLAARGVAVGDVDLDGRLDLYVLSIPSRHPGKLFANRTARSGRWLAVDGRGPGSRRSPLGDRLEVAAAGVVQYFQVSSGGSYLSGSARPVHVGLGTASAADLTVSDLRGSRRTFRDLPADHVVVLPRPAPLSPRSPRPESR